jgi:hypothetical protein
MFLPLLLAGAGELGKPEKAVFVMPYVRAVIP